MTIQRSVAVRNAQADAMEAIVGTSPRLELRSGAQPATCATADSGTLLATLVLPSDWVGAGSSGATTIAGGPWTGTCSTGGTVGHYRLKDSTVTTCHEQGSVTTVAVGTGDLLMDNNVMTATQSISIPTWTTTQGNA